MKLVSSLLVLSFASSVAWADVPRSSSASLTGMARDHDRKVVEERMRAASEQKRRDDAARAAARNRDAHSGRLNLNERTSVAPKVGIKDRSVGADVKRSF